MRSLDGRPPGSSYERALVTRDEPSIHHESDRKMVCVGQTSSPERARESDGELTPHVTGGRLRAKVLAVASLRGSGHAGNGAGVPPRVHPSDAAAKPGAGLLNP